MKRFFDLNTNTDSNFCDVIDPNYMVEIPDDGKPYGLIDGEVICVEKNPEYIAEQKRQNMLIQAQKTITKRQLLFWLFLKKQITEDSIFTAINSIPDQKNRYLGEKSYTGTNNFEFGNPFVPVIGQALGLTSDELVLMFDEASHL